MNRLLASLLTAFFMLLAQHGAVLHGFSHVDHVGHAGHAGHAGHVDHASSQEASSHGVDDQHHTADAFCDACLGFAHLAFASATDILPLGLLTHLGQQKLATPCATPPRLLALLPRSRGPPFLT